MSTKELRIFLLLLGVARIPRLNIQWPDRGNRVGGVDPLCQHFQLLRCLSTVTTRIRPRVMRSVRCHDAREQHSYQEDNDE